MKDEHSITWRVALVGAISALAGSAIGAVTSMYVAHEGYEQRNETRVVERRDRAYADFLAKAQAQSAQLDAISLNDVRLLTFDDGDAYQRFVFARQRRLLDMLAAISQPVASLTVYGSADAILAGLKVQSALTRAVGVVASDFADPKPKQKADAIQRLHNALAEFANTMRDDLGTSYE